MAASFARSRVHELKMTILLDLIAVSCAGPFADEFSIDSILKVVRTSCSSSLNL
jgi:hypothetical protein